MLLRISLSIHLIKEIEEKHGEDTRMVIEAMLPDDKEAEDYRKRNSCKMNFCGGVNFKIK